MIQTIRNLKIKEIFAFLFVVLLYLATQWRLWITKELMFTHDSIHWYGMFAYLADSLTKGVFPFWNPYMNCGEPFFLNLNILRLMDSSTFILIFLGKLLKISFLSLYHYDLLLRYFIFIGGSYLFFRYIAKYKISAFIALITISFSSLSVSYLRQHGLILDIYLLPWILLFALKFLEVKKPAYLVGLALFLGILLPSYTAMYIISFSAILFVALIISKGLLRPQWLIFFNNYKISLSAVLVLLFLSLRIIPIGLTSQNIVPTVRIHEVAYSAYSQPLDFLNLLAPYYFKWYFFINNLTMSESFLYIGLAPLLLSIVGLFFSSHRYKFGFLFTTVFVALLMLGDKSFVYPFMKRFFPFFSFIRNMHFFGPFFMFCLSYFTCIGADVIFKRVYPIRNKMPEASALPPSRISNGVYISNNLYEKLFNLSIILFIILILAGVIFSIFYFCNTAKNYHLPINSERLAILTTYCKTHSLYNALLFIFSGLIFFFFLIKAKRRYLKIAGTILVVSFILFDSVSFNRALYEYVVQPRPKGDFGLPSFATKTTYQNFRIPKSEVNFPFSAAIFKQFTAYHYFDSCGTHFFEMGDYYKLRTSAVLDDIKNVWMGITSPKLRLIPRCVVASYDYILGATTKIDPQTAKDVVFIEQDLPKRYSHLKTTLEYVSRDNPDLGKIQVKDFNPNEIVLDVYAKGDCFLYYSDGYDRSWRVFIDNKEDKVYKANLAFKAIVVSKGTHKVRFLYDPKFYRFSLFCYFVGLLSIVVISIKRIRSHFKRKES